MRHLPRFKIALITLSIFIATCIHAVTYSFSDIADSNSIGTVNSLGSPVLNLNGQMSFFVLRTNNTRQIMVGSGLGVSTIVGTGSLYSGVGGSGTLSSFSLTPSINNAGIVAWHSLINNGVKGDGIFVSDGGVTEIAHGTFTTGQFGALDDPTWINSGGAGTQSFTGSRVAFRGDSPDGSVRGLYKASNGSPPQTIVDNTAPFGSFDVYGPGDQMTSVGTIVFTAKKAGVAGVYTGMAGASSATVATGSFNGASINDSNLVAFNSNSTIFTRTVGGAGSATFVSTSTSGFTSFNFMGGGVLNNIGSIVFLAQNTSTGAASLFAGPNAANDRVIGVGSSLFGSTVSGIGGYSQNDNGQIAFNVVLANGVQAIVLATPIVAPVTSFNNSVSTGQNLQRDLGFTVSSAKGKATIIGDPATPSNGVIDFVDYEGSSVSSIKKVSATQAFIHVDLDYRFLSAGSFDIMLNGVTLQTFSNSASASYTHISNNYTLASFGITPGDMDLALRLNSGANTRELLVDNFNFSVPEPAHLTMLLGARLMLLRRRERAIAYNGANGHRRR
jgi:hypothetical protein